MNVRLFFIAMLARTYPRVAWLFRSRTWLVQETLLPVLSVAAFAYSYEWMKAPKEFVGFVILGAAMTTFWMNVLWSMGRISIGSAIRAISNSTSWLRPR